MRIKNERLIILSPIASANKLLTLIVVPTKLRKTTFQAYHTTGVGGHMGSYKTLLILCMRFFWPKMKSDVFAWVRQCAGCLATNGTRRENSSLVFSWPLATPFAIL